MNDEQDPLTCYTIGYGNLSFDAFLALLKKVGIEVIADARSIPYSRFNPSFRRPQLERLLNHDHIGYRFLGDRIGGRYSDSDLLCPDGSVNYDKVRDTGRFQEGIDLLVSVLSGGIRTAVMCAEKEPTRCHRFLLISPELMDRGVTVMHILPDGRVVPHEVLEQELMEDTTQATLSDRW